MRWRFTSDEFIYVCHEFGADRFPPPLSVVSSTRYESDWAAVESACRERIPVRQDPDLMAVLRTVFDPETSVEVVGRRGDPIRAYGAIVTDIGVGVVQYPGPDDDRGGDVSIRVGSVDLVPWMVSTVAGRCVAGRQGRMVEQLAHLQDPRSGASWASSGRPGAVTMRRLLAADRSGGGHVKISRGRRGADPASPRYVSWFDVRDDGRYVYSRRGEDIHVDPCDDKQLEDGVRSLLRIS